MIDVLLAGNGLVMLSSTSLLHGNCVFNRNNTVATQQGMKTYWLCKSYRISMCRARCITHQGRVISATGVHNHPPHMRSNSTTAGGTSVMGTMAAPTIAAVTGANYSLETVTSSGVSPQSNNTGGLLLQGVRSSSLYQQPAAHAHPHQHHHHMLMQQPPQQQPQPQPQQQQQQQTQHQQHHVQQHNNNNANETHAPPPPHHHPHHHHHHNALPLHHQHQHIHNGVIQNVMHLPNISMLPPPVHLQHQQHHAINSPLLDEHQQQQQQQQQHAHGNEDVLEITPLLTKSKSPIVVTEALTPTGLSSTVGEQLQLNTSSEHELLVPLSPNSRAASVDLNGTPTQAQELTASDDSTHHHHHHHQQQQQQQQQQQHHHQAHVIDSITISPNARHNFKLEQM